MCETIADRDDLAKLGEGGEHLLVRKVFIRGDFSEILAKQT